MADVRTLQVVADTTERLDRFLADQLALSRTQAARLIGTGAVTVNGAPGRAGRGLQRGDMIVVAFPATRQVRALRPHPIDLDVVYEDDVILVLDKPAGLVVHPAPGHWDDTLVNALQARGTKLSSIVAERPGIVHRLDRDTSGLMVLAKTEEAHRRLARALERRKVERIYAALVWGHLRGEREIDAPIARHPKDRKRMAVLATGRSARTRAHTIAQLEACDVVRVTLETGRTHQIRVHLAHIGHPVVGDPVYGEGGAKRVSDQHRPLAREIEAAAPRQVLHAAVLRFQHPATGQAMQFAAPWPEDLDACLRVAGGMPPSVARTSVLDYLGFLQ